jgi:hypothetical protein
MRKLLSILLIACSVTAYGQIYGYSFASYKDMVRAHDTRYGIPMDKVYSIGSEDVYGSPFLYEEWNKGNLVLVDGRVYDNYSFRYNAYDQTVHFKSGNDSLQVVDPIVEFTLNSDQKDSVYKYRFINSSRFWKKDPGAFYEVLYEDQFSMLLKKNKKIITRNTGNLPGMGEKKFFDLELSYFYFNKNGSKMDKLKLDGSNLLTVLGAEDMRDRIAANNWKMMNEDDRVKIVKLVHAK